MPQRLCKHNKIQTVSVLGTHLLISCKITSVLDLKNNRQQKKRCSAKIQHVSSKHYHTEIVSSTDEIAHHKLFQLELNYLQIQLFLYLALSVLTNLNQMMLESLFTVGNINLVKKCTAELQWNHANMFEMGSLS